MVVSTCLSAFALISTTDLHVFGYLPCMHFSGVVSVMLFRRCGMEVEDTADRVLKAPMNQPHQKVSLAHPKSELEHGLCGYQL